MSVLFFKKPQRIPWRGGPLTVYQRTPGSSSEGCRNATIPPGLSFENVICNKCAPPCSTQDFLDYLLYVEHRAENLQFYLWMVDYCQRFRHAPKPLTDLSPQWTDSLSRKYAGAVPVVPSGTPIDVDLDKQSADISSVSTWDCEQSEFSDHFTQTMNSIHFSVSPVNVTPDRTRKLSSTPKVLSQPFRAEINKIIAHYIAAGSPRQLNLSKEDRAKAIQALQRTTHPSALSPVKRMLDSTLRNESHPNFIRWSICNGTRPWTFTLRAFAIINIMIGFAIAVILTLSRASRYWRILAALEWWFGITNIIAASQGLCILLHQMHTRQFHPWEHQELSGEDDQAVSKDIEAGFVEYESIKPRWPVKMEVFGPANDYSGEAWVRLESRKAWYWKIFERRIPVQEPGLRNMQDRMTRQAEAWALIVTIPLTAGFVALPKGKYY